MSGVQPDSAASNSNASTGRKNYPGRRTDPGWKHGVDVVGNGKRVRCNYCAKVNHGGINRLKHHLAGSGIDSEPCASVPDEVREFMRNLVAEAAAVSRKKRQMIDISEGDEVEDAVARPQIVSKGKSIFSLASKGKSTGGGVQQVLNEMMKKDLKEQAYDQIAQFFYTSAIPFNVVKNPDFARMLETVGRYGCGFKPPSYHDIREKLLKRAVSRTDEMLEAFKEEWKRTGCTIMSDGWTDRKRRSICNFLVNSPKGTVFLYSLDTSDISKTTDKVFKMLDDVVNYVGAENVVQVVTDNAANYKAAGERLMQTRDNLYWTPCAAHCIDLILEDFEKNLNVHKVTIKKGRKITTYIYSRTLLITLLRKSTNGRELIRPGATRFATVYLTLSCLNELQTPLMAMFDSEEWKSSKFASSLDGKKVQKIIKDGQFWKNIVTCLKAANPMIGVLRLVDSDEKPAMGFIYDAMDTAKERIKANFKNVKKRYEPVWNIIDERWDKQLHRPLHAAGYYLNPHLHWESNFRKDDIEVKEGLYSCMRRMEGNAMVRKKMHAQLPEFHYRKGLFGLEDAQSARKNLTPAEWWDFYGDSCPELKNFAIRVLSLTCSSSGCERNWSSFEMVHTKKRNRLHQKKMNDLVYVMYNLKLKGKQVRRSVSSPFEDIASDDEWITEVGEDVNVDEEEVGLGPLDDVNVDLVGSSNLANDDAIQETFSSDDEDLDEDNDNDDEGESEDEDHVMEDDGGA